MKPCILVPVPAPGSITVIIPALNEGPRIQAAVASVAAGAAEVIVVDGGSTDATVPEADAPKIAGLLIALKLMAPGLGTADLGVAMAAGGLLAVRRVARTLAFGITGMNGAEGLSANLVTAGPVMLASPLGLPVSTTHVSCGALFGIGAANGEARWKMIGAIVAAWGITLPVAGALSALAAAALSITH